MSLHGEILRSEQKDESYITYLRNSISSLYISTFGAQDYAHKDKWIGPVAKLIYFTSTTLRDFQSLGEEYTGLVLINPSTLTRILFIISKSFGPNILDYILLKLQVSGSTDRIKKFISLLNTLNTCIFFYQGLYKDVHRRVFGLQYAKIGKQTEDNSSQYRMLGHVAVVQLMLALGMELYSLYRSFNKTSQPQSKSLNESSLTNQLPESNRCPLCLETLGFRGGSAATPCGHLGCWTCLLEAAACSGECPLCRASINGRIIPLMN